MGFADGIRSAVAAALAATADLRENVTVEAFSAASSQGEHEEPSAPVVYLCFVQRQKGSHQTSDGEKFDYKAAIGFTESVDIQPHFRITLNDGLSGYPYVAQGGLCDPKTGLPFARTVYLR